MREWSNGKIRVDDRGVWCGSFFVPLDRATACHEPERVSIHAIRAAVECPGASLDEIVDAFTHVFVRTKVRQPHWRNTRERMRTWRLAWPIIARACRRAIAGEDEFVKATRGIVNVHRRFRKLPSQPTRRLA